jgi:hypothetical protein
MAEVLAVALDRAEHGDHPLALDRDSVEVTLTKALAPA